MSVQSTVDDHRQLPRAAAVRRRCGGHRIWQQMAGAVCTCFIAMLAGGTVTAVQAQASVVVSNLSSAYVNQLATCAFSLVTANCVGYGLGLDCPGYDGSGRSDIVQQCQIGLDNAPSNPCLADSNPDYSYPLHIGSVFVILVCSLLGAGLPLAGQYVAWLKVDDYHLCIGKCLGIGILLACALVHLLQPASQELNNVCLSKAFTDEYTSYAFLFAMLAIMAMQFLDFAVEAFLVGRVHQQRPPPPKGGAKGRAISEDECNSPHAIVQMVAPASPGTDLDKQASSPSSAAAAASEASGGGVCVHVHMISATAAGDHAATLAADSFPPKLTSSDGAPPIQLAKTVEKPHDDVDHHHHHPSSSHGADDDVDEGHGHTHGVLLTRGVKRTIAAWMLEFGMTIHSYLIGITSGVVGDGALRVLLVALCFHQCFEGVSLGSRIADARLGSRLEEVGMVLLFATSAPIGMAIGISVTSAVNPNGATYSYTAGVFDGVCAGILLYIGLVLLLHDFPADMKRHCKNSPARKLVMFLALWTGGGAMAFLGKYL